MKRMLLAFGLVGALAACNEGGNRPASEYVDSTTTTPNSTVNPPDNTGTGGMDTTTSGTGSVSSDTAMRADTTGRSGRRDSAR